MEGEKGRVESYAICYPLHADTIDTAGKTLSSKFVAFACQLVWKFEELLRVSSK